MKLNFYFLLLSCIFISTSMYAQTNDGVCSPTSSVNSPVVTNLPATNMVCSDLSNAPTFTLPTANLPDVEFIVEVNGTITDNNTTALPSGTLQSGDQVCVTAIAYDLAEINNTLNSLNSFCGNFFIDCDALTGVPGAEQLLEGLVNGENDGQAGLNSLEEALTLSTLSGGAVAASVADATAGLDAANAQISLLAGNICYATSAPICYEIEDCSSNAVNVALQFVLESVTDATTGLMSSNLQNLDLLPYSQPFNVAPYNYAGTENVASFPATNIIDWVLIQALDANNLETVVESRACFLLEDGTLLDTDGAAGVNFQTLDSSVNYRFAIYHKAHLGVLSAAAIAVPTTSTYDFSVAETMAEGIQALKAVGNKYALYAGDFDNNGIINSLDFNIWQTGAAIVNQYIHWDADLNGISNVSDYNAWTNNRSKVGIPEIALP